MYTIWVKCLAEPHAALALQRIAFGCVCMAWVVRKGANALLINSSLIYLIKHTDCQ